MLLYNTIWPYIELVRLNKPAGGILVFFPFAYGLTMAGYSSKLPLPEYVRLSLVSLLWAFQARSMACTINDICDREIDRRVERTKHRPLADGRASLGIAWLYLIVQSLLCIASFMSINDTTFKYSIMWFPLIYLYPLMKRVTSYPQMWLGVAANWGVLLAWLMIHNEIQNNVVLPLLIGLWAWNMFYDTIYACQDSKDDEKLGVGSSAVAMKGALFQFLFCCIAIFVISITMAGIANNQGIWYYAISVFGAGIELLHQLWTLNPNDSDSCAKILARNSRLGCILWGGMMIEYLAETI